jgi:crotonobetainyl-CoA:carnitine CoA-transferase CaiB-like acyl-CoA transferase
MSGGSPRPLDGIRVLDLSNLMAGPIATMYLADFGADVIKVEHPVRGDELRNWGRAKDGFALYFKMVNRNKRLVTLDLKSDGGRRLALQLATISDVVVENYRTGTLERWGLGWDDLHTVNPRLVMARVTGFGQTGPYAERPGFGTLAEAFSGSAAISGYPDRPPLLPAFGLGDASTGIHVAFGILAALRHRDATGEGQVIDAALYDGLFSLLGPQVVDYDQLGVVQERNGSRLPFVAPRNTYETADGRWVAIAGATQATFERIAETLGIAHLLEDPRFADNRARIANCEALDEEIQGAVGRFGFEELMQIFGDASAPVGPAYDVAQIFADPQYAARGNIATVEDADLGPLRMQAPVPRLLGSPGRIEHSAGRLGEHNAVVYGELLGLGADELAELAAAKVI